MVVVGVDFSPGAARALAAGRVLAERQGWDLCTVHVTRKDAGPWRPARREAAWLHEQNVEPGSLRLRVGEPWIELVKLADEVSAEMLVAGTHGESGFQPFQLGSTATHVALRSRSPVMLVPTGTPVRKPDNAGNNEETP